MLVVHYIHIYIYIYRGYIWFVGPSGRMEKKKETTIV